MSLGRGGRGRATPRRSTRTTSATARSAASTSPASSSAPCSRTTRTTARSCGTTSTWWSSSAPSSGPAVEAHARGAAASSTADAARRRLPTAEGVPRARRARLVTDELVVLPVRHHSPACALARARRRSPSATPVASCSSRGRAASTPLSRCSPPRGAAAARGLHLVRPRAGPRDRAGRAATARYYPFCDYSPELVALREAAAAGIPARSATSSFAEQALRRRPRAAADAGRVAARRAALRAQPRPAARSPSGSGAATTRTCGSCSSRPRRVPTSRSTSRG